MNRFLRHGKAFTLVEVLIVVAIMGLAAAVVIPQMLNPGSLHVQAAVRTVVADIMVAQNEAVVRQASRQVLFDTQTQQYTLTDDDEVPLVASDRRGDVYRVSFLRDSRYRGVRIENVNFGVLEADKHRIRFDEMGAPDQGGSLDVVSGTARYRINVAPMTGKVTLEEVTSGG